MLPDENQATATGSSQQQRAQKIGNDWISDMELGQWVIFHVQVTRSSF